MLLYNDDMEFSQRRHSFTADNDKDGSGLALFEEEYGSFRLRQHEVLLKSMIEDSELNARTKMESVRDNIIKDKDWRKENVGLQLARNSEKARLQSAPFTTTNANAITNKLPSSTPNPGAKNETTQPSKSKNPGRVLKEGKVCLLS
jgi:hypothetical protein